ncbi:MULTISPECIES: type II toxin-antitoxin system HicA family toxin [Enterocloster]|uniref:type II toxin-antitoxin system HicA family toxin n=1 Tax=Enterocloster TaxID=2719313 RepID=UPI000D1A33EA|nr:MULTISPECIES: type II toxin-antitoxin system HicA family toxin [Enterocloster]MDR3756191.1 type II toxin-antitoxin system HicA family toxin [Enterocloster sp.]PST34351.1 toxin-antitoxin system, toxin component, HicA family protein [Enterocloster lavalensis]
MKRKDLIKKLEVAGFCFKEHGGNHDTYKRGHDTEQVPRHTEINEITTKRILKKWGLK